VAIYHTGSRECIHVGPGLGNCVNTVPWPAHFQSATNGLYTTLLDVQEFGFRFYEGMEYKVCVGNADVLSDNTMSYSTFVGDVALFGLTREIESTVSVVSEVGEPLTAAFDMRVRQAQSLCTSAFAMGDLQYVNMTVDFTNGDSTRLSDELILAIYHKGTQDCVQFGPGLSTCSNLQPWPASFQSTANGLYTALLDVQEFGFSFNEGMEYMICVGNGDRLSDNQMAYSYFVGDVTFFGFTSEIESTIAVTSEVAVSPMLTEFDMRLRQSQYLCTSFFAMGDLNFVNVTVDFTNGDTTRLSDELLLAIYHKESGTCIHFGPGLQSCTNLQAWPRNFQTTVSGLYTSLLDVQEFNFNFDEGMEYTMCIGNADRITDENMAYSRFVGDLSLFDFSTEIESTVVVTSDINEGFSVDFDLRVRNEQSLCTSGFAWGNMTSMVINLDFTNGDMSMLSAELVLVLHHVSSNKCVQFGQGLQVECDSYYPWPSTFDAVASRQYTATLDVSEFHFNTEDSSLFRVCLGNEDPAATNTQAYSYFVGDATFNGMVTKAEFAPTAAPTSASAVSSSGGSENVDLDAVYISVGIIVGLFSIFIIWYAVRAEKKDDIVTTINIGDAKLEGDQSEATSNPLNKHADPSENL
jgi:hypothetical protein